jgi:hypothetical protein
VIFDEEIERCKNNIDKHVRIRRCQASGGAVVDRLDSRAWIRGRKDASVCMCACPVLVVWCRAVCGCSCGACPFNVAVAVGFGLRMYARLQRSCLTVYVGQPSGR